VNLFDRIHEPPWVPPEFADENGLVGVGGDLEPNCLLRGYVEGVFPWFSEGDPVLWWSPNPRAIFDINNGLQIGKRLARTIRSGKFQTTRNQCFEIVIRACGDRPEGTWITDEMIEAYVRLHELGFAHSVESWYNGELAGGVYGVAVNGFFAAESMFYRVSDGSKVALAALFDHLKLRGYELVDTQMLTEHTARLGAFEIHRNSYLSRLKHAVAKHGVRFV
jgi:leucyl/phenylalanyl-tRNA---protein transferase